MTAMIGEYIAGQRVPVKVVFPDEAETTGRILSHDEIGIVIKTSRSGHIMFVPYAAMSCILVECGEFGVDE